MHDLINLLDQRLGKAAFNALVRSGLSNYAAYVRISNNWRGAVADAEKNNTLSSLCYPRVFGVSAPAYISRRSNPGHQIASQIDKQIMDQGLSCDFASVAALLAAIPADDREQYQIQLTGHDFEDDGND